MAKLVLYSDKPEPELELEALGGVSARQARKAPQGYWTGPGCMPLGKSSARHAVELGTGTAYLLESVWLAYALVGRLQRARA